MCLSGKLDTKLCRIQRGFRQTLGVGTWRRFVWTVFCRPLPSPVCTIQVSWSGSKRPRLWARWVPYLWRRSFTNCQRKCPGNLSYMCCQQSFDTPRSIWQAWRSGIKTRIPKIWLRLPFLLWFSSALQLRWTASKGTSRQWACTMLLVGACSGKCPLNLPQALVQPSGRLWFCSASTVWNQSGVPLLHSSSLKCLLSWNSQSLSKFSAVKRQTHLILTVDLSRQVLRFSQKDGVRKTLRCLCPITVSSPPQERGDNFQAFQSHLNSFKLIIWQ